MNRRDLLQRAARSVMAVLGGVGAGGQALSKEHKVQKVNYLLSVKGVLDLRESETVDIGDLVQTPAGTFQITEFGLFEDNGSTVLGLNDQRGQAVLAPSAPFDDIPSLLNDTRGPSWFDIGQTITVSKPNVSFDVVGHRDDGHHLETAGGVKLVCVSPATGTIPPDVFQVRPATAKPSPVDNAARFQKWVDAHPDLQTIHLPNWEIELGSGIAFGRRNVFGQGDASKLRFVDVPMDQDAVTLASGTMPGARAGVLRGFTIDCNGSGRDAVRWTGGIGCGAEFVTVIRAGRDMFHFEQASNKQFFERAFLNQCSGNKGCGRYGLCLELAPLGVDDIQFINKSCFMDTKLYGARVADVAFVLNSNDAGGTDTKIGGGVDFRNFHTQYQGRDATRRDGAVLVYRAATSRAYIDFLNFDFCTFESQGSGDGAPVHARGLEVVDEAADMAPVIRSFQDRNTLLTGYSTWWDYREKPTFTNTYRIETPLQGTTTNLSQRQFGTRSDAAGTTHVPKKGSTELFSAGSDGAVWLTTIRTSGHSNDHATAIILGGKTPRAHPLTQSGMLTIDCDAQKVVAKNSGNGPRYCYWSAVPIAL